MLVTHEVLQTDPGHVSCHPELPLQPLASSSQRQASLAARAQGTGGCFLLVFVIAAPAAVRTTCLLLLVLNVLPYRRIPPLLYRRISSVYCSSTPPPLQQRRAPELQNCRPLRSGRLALAPLPRLTHPIALPRCRRRRCDTPGGVLPLPLGAVILPLEMMRQSCVVIVAFVSVP